MCVYTYICINICLHKYVVPPLLHLRSGGLGLGLGYICVCVYIYMHMYIYKYMVGPLLHLRSGGWPLQDIVVLLGFCARINHPSIALSNLHSPHYCNTIARLSRKIRRLPDTPCVCRTTYNIGNNNIV